MKRFLSLLTAIVICAILCLQKGYAQNVSINNDGAPPHPSAMLDINHPAKGLLIPRVALTGTDDVATIPSPAVSLLVYNTATVAGSPNYVAPGYYYWNGSVWLRLSTGSGAAPAPSWQLAGNAGTDPAINFLGTIDQNPLRLRLNNYWAGELNASSKNYFIGDSAGIASITGIKNVALGSKTLVNNLGSSNSAIGNEALYSNTSGNENTATGSNSLFFHKRGDGNTATGAYALFSDTTGNENTAIGYYSMGSNTSGSWNTAVGERALLSNTTGFFNTALGNSALRFSTSANYNTAVGVDALFNDTSGQANTAIGISALRQNLKGNYNTAVGSSALSNNKTDYNTAVGGYALYYDTTGAYNTSVGYGSLFLNRTGSFNTAVGQSSIYSNTTGYGNTAVGYAALNLNSTGTNNAAIGDSALLNSTGSFNTAVGSKSLINLSTGSNNIAIGNGSGNDPGSPNVFNTISIGNAGILNAANNQAFFGNLSMVWNGGNKPWSTYSDARMKNNIPEDVKGLDFIIRLKPVTYYRSIDAVIKITGSEKTDDFPGKYDAEKIKETGFLAQDVEHAAKAAGYEFSGVTIPSKSNQLYTLSYELFVVPLVKAVQEQQKIIEDQTKDINVLKAQVAELAAAVKTSIHK